MSMEAFTLCGVSSLLNGLSFTLFISFTLNNIMFTSTYKCNLGKRKQFLIHFMFPLKSIVKREIKQIIS